MICIDLWDRNSDNHRSQCPRNQIVEHPAIIKQPSFFICITYGQNSITLPSNNQSAEVSVTAHLEWICVSPALQLEVPSCWDNFGAHPLRASRPPPPRRPPWGCPSRNSCDGGVSSKLLACWSADPVQQCQVRYKPIQLNQIQIKM